ncbi:MAG: hypothetical protein QM535_18240 [Limnohabitans sp.]|nr:hypothetical protein [Limnohabitans sp.]
MNEIIQILFQDFQEIRYVAIYQNNQLFSQQKQTASNASDSESDKYEELLVNPALLTLARQRGNIDCGGLRYLIIGYGNFFQLVKEIPNGHISICLDKESDIKTLPDLIFDCFEKIQWC